MDKVEKDYMIKFANCYFKADKEKQVYLNFKTKEAIYLRYIKNKWKKVSDDFTFIINLIDRM